MRRPIRYTAASAAALVALGSGTVAQDTDAEPAGPRLVLTYQLELGVDDNKRLQATSAGTTYDIDNVVGLSFRSETRNQSLALNTSLTARLFDDPQGNGWESDLGQGGLDLDYVRTASRSQLTFGANYRQQDLVLAEPFFLDIDGDTIIDEAGFLRREGTVTRASARARLETGIDRPISTTYSVEASARTYSENDDPDLFDSRSYGVGVTTRLRFSPILTGRVAANYRRTDYDNPLEEEAEVVTLSTGASYAIDPTLDVDASIGYSRRTETDGLGDSRSESIDEGLNASLDVSKDLPNGDIFGALSRSVQDAGFRTSLEVGRTLEFSTSSFTASVGLTVLDDMDPGSIFRLAYERALPDGSLGASLRRRVAYNTLGDENLLTAAEVSYAKQVNTLTTLGLNFDVARIQEAADENDAERTEMSFTASVGRTLTRDWSLNAGYRGRYNDIGGGDDALSNSLFVRLGRDFIIRP